MRVTVLALVALAGAARADVVEIKIATLAPSGSSWAKIMESSSARLERETAGRGKLRFYLNAAQGRQADLGRRIKLQQLDGAALSAVGLGMLDPEVLVLQLPYLFTTDAQIDRVRADIGPDLERGLEAAGVTLVAWGDVGWVATYFTEGILNPA